MSTLLEIASRLQTDAIRAGVTVASAESCTGGNIAHQITSISGSSAYFLGGVVSYANHVKSHVLGVAEEILANPGSVSEPCAREMAEGVRKLLGSDVAVSTTGIAGPLGGTTRKPVGLVYVGLATAAGTVVERHVFPGDRAEVIAAATRRALEMLAEGVAQTAATP